MDLDSALWILRPSGSYLLLFKSDQNLKIICTYAKKMDRSLNGSN